MEFYKAPRKAGLKKAILLPLVCLLLCPRVAASAKKADYTLSKKESTVLQNEADRSVTLPAEAAARETIAGESPVTGLPWEDEYLPMLVVIGNYVTTAKVNGRDVKASGIGKNAPWGLQYADVVYEELIYAGGTTRFTALFSDCFAAEQPAGGVGPVRSCRVGPLLLREAWQAGLVYGGGILGSFRGGGDATAQVLAETGAEATGALFDTLAPEYHRLGSRVRAAKAPNNFNIDLIALRGLIPATYVSTPHPFLFTDAAVYGAAYEAADTIHLDWGYKYNLSHFVYDEGQNAYLRYCGAGKNPAKWAPFTTFASAEDRADENRRQVAFANVIVQRVAYEFEGGHDMKPVPQCVGTGNADIFIGGRYIPGTWARATLSDPTVYYDDHGDELRLNRGKTFVAQFPPEALCAFTADN